MKLNQGFAMEKASFNGKKTFHQEIGLQFKKETSEELHLEHNIVCCRNLDTPESRAERLKKF